MVDWKLHIIAVVRFSACYLSCLLIPILVWLNSSAGRGQALPCGVVTCDLILLLTLIVKPVSNGVAQTMLCCSTLPSVMWFGWSRSGTDMLMLVGMVKLAFLGSMYTTTLKVFGNAVSDTVSRITAVGLAYALFASTMACAWFATACSSPARSLTEPSWVAEDVATGILEYDSLASRYFRSLHFVTQTLATVGYGDIHPVTLPETLFSLLLVLSGALFYGYVISCITSLLSSQDFTTKLFRSVLTTLKDYLKLRKVPEGVRDRFTAYFEYLYTRQKGLSEEAVLGSLPAQVASDLRQHCCLQILRTVPFFMARPDGDSLTAQCANRMALVTYGPGAALSGAAQRGRTLFLIRSGKVDLVSPVTQKPALSLLAGDYFGDHHMLFGCPMEVEAVSAGFTEVATLR